MQFCRIIAAAALAAAVLLGGCAGAPEEVEPISAAPGPAKVALAAALPLIEAAAPEQLREAIEMLQGEASSLAEAGEQASFATAVFELLYPELAGQGYLSEVGYVDPYSGPFRDTLDRASSGQQPAGGAGQPGNRFFDLVVPSLFLARLPEPAAGTEAGISDLDGYRRALEQADTMNPSSVLPPFLLGRINELEGELDKAASLFKESVDRADSFYPARKRLAEILLAQQQPEQAATVLTESAEPIPVDASLRYTLARAYLQTGRLEESSTEVAKALIDQPDRPELILLRARVLLAQGNWNQALRPLNMLLYRHPDNREAYLLYAEILYDRAKRAEEALELLAEAEAGFPGAPEFPELAGRILLETGRNAEGLVKLQKALDLEPGRLSTLQLLLSDATHMKRWLQAAIYLSEILEQEQSAEDLRQAIRIYSNLGDSAQSLYYAEILYQSSPTETDLVTYARALLGADEKQRAEQVVDKGLESVQTAEARSSFYTLKAILVQDSSPEQALQFVKEALMENPDDLEAVLEIAELYVEQRELRKAALYLKHAVQLNPDDAALRVQLENIEQQLNANP